MKMAAIYARVSSEQQREENTIASQTASLIEFAKSHDLEVPKEWVFEDEGYSGATLERPGLERVRDLAAEGQIRVVLAYSPDRLSRKYAYQILLIEEFARHGVETVFVKSPPGDSAEDQLLVQFQGMIAEYERAQILERSRRGKRHRAQAGEVSVMSGAPYGYRYIRKTDEVPAAYVVDEAEARVVRRVYQMYTIEGLSIGEITRQLNSEGVPARRASRWERSVVWGVLRNPAYRGVACFGKTRISARTPVMPSTKRKYDSIVSSTRWPASSLRSGCVDERSSFTASFTLCVTVFEDSIRFVQLGTPLICCLLQKPSRKFEDLEQRTIALSCAGF